MRMFLFPPAKATTLGGSAALSLATHVVLITSAVYATAERSREVEQAIRERISFVRYLPPPDRTRSAVGVGEVLRYVQQGGGGMPLPIRADGQLRREAGIASLLHDGGALGADLRDQAPVKEVVSPDSVYSVLSVEEAATRTPGSAAPIYPPELLRDGVEGWVTVQFVVDTLGRADSASLVVIAYTHPGFAKSVRQAVPLMTFSAATASGHKVRQMVEQRFGFMLQPGDVRAISPLKPVP
jgi:TonB family C-terminal domain